MAPNDLRASIQRAERECEALESQLEALVRHGSANTGVDIATITRSLFRARHEAARLRERARGLGTPHTESELFAMGPLHICQELHMAGTGASDPMFSDERDELVDYLRFRLAAWTASRGAYDDAVRAIIEATIAEEPGALRCSRPARRSE